MAAIADPIIEGFRLLLEQRIVQIDRSDPDDPKWGLRRLTDAEFDALPNDAWSAYLMAHAAWVRRCFDFEGITRICNMADQAELQLMAERVEHG